MTREKAEDDTERDPARVDSREPDEEYVGRIAADESDGGEESGAERRAQAGEGGSG
jgi:hypothetical protein